MKTPNYLPKTARRSVPQDGREIRNPLGHKGQGFRGKAKGIPPDPRKFIAFVAFVAPHCIQSA
jgi:hypothetical protein